MKINKFWNELEEEFKLLKNNLKDEKLYPIYYDNKYWEEYDCSDIFTSFYHDRESLNFEMGVYVSEGIWVYPDGKTEEW